ncbi:hypothetical protein K239x_48320 [Planctomycetes bacterium K23_9]|uniref:Uncharacterized protein n=1 Tax=Stieleria marina TaxID=1930275 RepID=A0A517P0C1_9BACT|nr:hypothetical protein K239x_48320 [Planctomycetes bacterium K23_9]
MLTSGFLCANPISQIRKDCREPRVYAAGTQFAGPFSWWAGCLCRPHCVPAEIYNSNSTELNAFFLGAFGQQVRSPFAALILA